MIDLNVKKFALQNNRKQPFFVELSRFSIFLQKSKSFNDFIRKTRKTKFIKIFTEKASKIFTQAIADESVIKIMKMRGIKHWTNQLSKQREKEQINEKQRLLENIYCHRRLNSFFNFYRKIKFRK